MTTPPPSPGSVVLVRRRHWLVSDVIPGERRDDPALVRLRCLDDDAPGEPLDVLWSLEIGTRIFREEEITFGVLCPPQPGRQGPAV